MSRKILVVDDSQIVTKMLSGLFRDAGYEVETVNSPFGVSNALLEFRPDLMIMDLKMPGLNGAKIIELVAKRKYDFEFGIMVFSSEDEATLGRVSCLDGVSACIRKGTPTDEILRTVNGFMKESTPNPAHL